MKHTHHILGVCFLRIKRGLLGGEVAFTSTLEDVCELDLSLKQPNRTPLLASDPNLKMIVLA